jgi:hypothetical protein
VVSGRGTLKWHFIRTKLNRRKLAFMRMAGGFIWSCAKAVIGCGLPLHDVDGKRAQMEFGRVGDSAAGDLLTLSSARNKAGEYGSP